MLLGNPDESEMTVSVDDLEKRFERKRKYAEMFKEKQQKLQQMPEKKPFIPTVVCHFFVEGRCQKGDKCTFLHKTEKKLELCKYYQGGYCSKADKCTYMHGDFPCKFFHSGKKCIHADNCRFSHEPLSDPALRDAFEKYLRQDGSSNANGVDLSSLSAIKSSSGLLAATSSSEASSSLPSLMNLAVKPVTQSDDVNKSEPVIKWVSFKLCYYLI